MVAKKPAQQKQAEKILSQSRAATNSSHRAPADPVDVDAKSHLSSTPTYYNELAALDAKTLRSVDLNDVEMRIGLLSRVILEHVLRISFPEAKLLGMSAKDRADIALRAISTLEGSKQEIRWKDELAAKPDKIDMEQYKQERAAAEERLKRLLYRKQEVKIAAAETALKELGEPPPDESDLN